MTERFHIEIVGRERHPRFDRHAHILLGNLSHTSVYRLLHFGIFCIEEILREDIEYVISSRKIIGAPNVISHFFQFIYIIFYVFQDKFVNILSKTIITI